jgi:RHH-type transcriptional regulator, rel operon repressor / antitoxin RelB
MAESTTITIRVDKATKDRLEKVARHTKRSKSFLAAEAIEEFLSVQEWQERRIRDARASADRGEVISHEDVLQWVRSWETEDERPMPKA